MQEDERVAANIETLTDAAKRRTIIKIALRVLPLLFVCYMVAYLDRVNVGYAALQMNEDIGLSSATFGLGAGIFFIGYFLFELPSNLVLERVGARRWIARIMITWGIIAMAMSLVTGPMSFYILRFLLGVAEAGFFPGVILYLTYWFPEHYLSRVNTLFLAAIPVVSIFAGPFSGWLLTLDGLAGLAGWQILFIVQGLPAIILAFLVFLFLTDQPDQARWLRMEEREWLTSVLERERLHKVNRREYTLKEMFVNPKVLVLTAVYFGILTSLFAVALWLPLIIQNFSSDLGPLTIGFLASIPYIGATIGMILFALHSDATGERRWHVAIPAVLAAIGLTGSAVSPSPYVSLALLTLAAVGIYSTLGTFWTIPAAFLTGTASAGAIAIIGATGNLGGFVGPYVVGYVRETSGSFVGGLLFLAALILLSGILVLTIRTEQAAEETTSYPPVSRGE